MSGLMKFLDFLNKNVNSLGLLVAFVAFAFSIYTFREQRKLNKQTVEPKIDCILEFPFKVENGKSQKSINPKLTIVNNGPIEVVSITVDHIFYCYDTNSNKISSMGKAIMSPYDFLIFEKEFKPSDHKSSELCGISGSNFIGIYEFNIVYYRSADMKHYARKDLFFLYENKIYNQKQFMENTFYKGILKALTAKDYKQEINTIKNK